MLHPVRSALSPAAPPLPPPEPSPPARSPVNGHRVSPAKKERACKDIHASPWASAFTRPPPY
eukprot:912287-Rhodomonas_salina.1